MKTLKLLRLGAGERLERLLCRALAGVPAEAAALMDAECGLDGSRILFALHIDEYGAEESLHTLLRTLRRSPGALRGSVCGIVVDGDGELYTKAAAQALADLVGDDLSADYIIPAAFDPRVGPAVAKAVAEAARRSGVARI